VALTSFFFTFFKVFLNGLLDLFVALNPRLMERVGGWQAFFLAFLKVFLNPKERGLRGYSGRWIFCSTARQKRTLKNG
jgi:hypothetical protein